MRKPALLACFVCFGAASTAVAQTTVQITTAFSPNPTGQTPIADQWVSTIMGATASIKITLYNFTLTAVKDALLQAKRRNSNLDLRGILDESQLHNCNLYELFEAGAAFRIWRPRDSRDLVHHKFMIVDGAGPSPVVVTGSANFTLTGVQFSHENQSVFRYLSGSRAFFDDFDAQFERMWAGAFSFPAGQFEDWRPEPGYCGR